MKKLILTLALINTTLGGLQAFPDIKECGTKGITHSKQTFYMTDLKLLKLSIDKHGSSYHGSCPITSHDIYVDWENEYCAIMDSEGTLERSDNWTQSFIDGFDTLEFIFNKNKIIFYRDSVESKVNHRVIAYTFVEYID